MIAQTYIPLEAALYGLILLSLASFCIGFALGIRCRTCRKIAQLKRANMRKAQRERVEVKQ